LAGNLAIDVDAAHAALARLAEPLQLSVQETALGIVRIANEHMARALRVISVQRGFDPQDFYLCSFGGAGGLHVCDLAEQLHMHKAIVPQFAGVLSAFGMLVAPRERHLSHTIQTPLAQASPQEITNALQQLAERGIKELLAEGVILEQIQTHASVDLRYGGQSYAINIVFENIDQCNAQFHRRHEQLYGHRLQRAIELVTLRQRVFSPALAIDFPLIEARASGDELNAELFGIGSVRVLPRDALTPHQTLSGPLLITEAVATTFIKPGWHVVADSWGNLLLGNL
jgi:N-methylhydantoinase A